MTKKKLHGTKWDAMPKKRVTQAAMILFLLELIPPESKEILLTFEAMLQDATTAEEKLAGETRIYLYLRMLTDNQLISDTEEAQLSKYFIPKF